MTNKQLWNKLLCYIDRGISCHGGHIFEEYGNFPDEDDEGEDLIRTPMPAIESCTEDLTKMYYGAKNLVGMQIGIAREEMDAYKEEDWIELNDEKLLSKLCTIDSLPYGCSNTLLVIKLIKIRLQQDASQLPEYQTHEESKVIEYAKLLYEEIVKGIEYKEFWIDMWQMTYTANGETHGTFFGMCFESTDPEVWKLGVRVGEHLDKFYGGFEWDT